MLGCDTIKPSAVSVSGGAHGTAVYGKKNWQPSRTTYCWTTTGAGRMLIPVKKEKKRAEVCAGVATTSRALRGRVAVASGQQQQASSYSVSNVGCLQLLGVVVCNSPSPVLTLRVVAITLSKCKRDGGRKKKSRKKVVERVGREGATEVTADTGKTWRPEDQQTVQLGS